MINGLRTLGVYIHIPFCKSKCGYCDFYSLQDGDKLFAKYEDALIKQIREFFQVGGAAYTVDTIYFGGGTPSHFGGARIAKVLKALKACAKVSASCEITVEANPESADKAFYKAVRAAGVNRISLGVQSSFDEELLAIGRAHNFEQAEKSVALCKKYCTDNLSLDLIYGLPGQTVEMFLTSLKKVLDLAPKHLSVYALKLEEGTPMHKQNLQLPDEDTQADMYLKGCDILAQSGFAQYEISNFGARGMISRHNAKYWDLSEYIGFGTAAHSFLNGKRFDIICDVQKYVERMHDGGTIIRRQDEIAYNNRLGEYIMLRLRTTAGIKQEVIENRYQADFAPLERKLKKYLDNGFARYLDGAYSLTPKGFLVSNVIISDLLDEVYEDSVYV